MNKIKSFKSHALVRHCLLVMVGMLCALPSWAREVVENGVVYEVNKKEQKAVVVDFNYELSSTTEIQKYVSGYLVSGIESYAFRDCPNLESITIPASAFNIGEYAFDNCYYLKSINITDDGYNHYYDYSIGQSAFQGCSALTAINIPSSVTSIGYYAFLSCSDLKTIRFNGKTPPSIDYFVFGDVSDLKIYVPHGTLEAYRNALKDKVNNAEILEENQMSLYAQALELTSPDYSPLAPSYTVGKQLLTAVSQLSTNAPEPKEGSLEYLLDGDNATYFHSRWSEQNPDNSLAYIQVDLKESCQILLLNYRKRDTQDNKGYPTTLHLFATDTPNDANSWTDCGEQTLKYMEDGNQSGKTLLDLGKSYRYIRLQVENTGDNNKANGNLYFAWSELDIKKVTNWHKAEYSANDGLLTDASQLSSNAIEPTEGSLAALIDNDRTSFFHSTWSVKNTTGDLHYLQMDLRAPYKQIVLKYTKRQAYNDGTPVKLHIYATNTPDAADSWEDLGTQTCTYDYESAQTGILPLSLGNGYRHVRLTVEETVGNKKDNENLSFYWSELHAYHRPCKADILDDAKRTALTTAMAQAKKEMDAGLETGETTDALQDALTDAENFISLNECKTVDFAKSFYLTAYSDKPMTVPTGMQAAIVLADNNGGIRTDYRYNAGDIIPAHTGVLLKSGKGNAFYLPTAETAEDAPEDNLLHGTLTDEMTYAEGCDRYYKLSYDFETRSVIGFYWAEDNAAPFLNKAGKAFLALPSNAKVGVYGISLNELAEGTTTGIRPTTDAPAAPFRAYTLDGRRVNAASQSELKKGFYIINGRKVMVK